MDYHSILHERRRDLATQLSDPVLLWAGEAPMRNFAANRYPFRASSSFLYFAGQPIEGAVIGLIEGDLELFYDEPPPSAVMWMGDLPSRAALAEQMGAAAHFPLAQLPERFPHGATVAALDPVTRQKQTACLARPMVSLEDAPDCDRALAQAIISLRLCHDEYAIAALQQAAQITMEAHLIGLQTIPYAEKEAEVRGAMEAVITAAGMTCAYPSIVTTHGEILHADTSPHPLNPGDLLLIDLGAETPQGWAADMTRTLPITGRFSDSQRAIYEIVLAAHDGCIAAIQPAVEFSEIHRIALDTMTAGLLDLGILRGTGKELEELDVTALFFPHGVGHLVGLDVHDLEEFGDWAGYAPGRKRRDRPSWRYLRLDRPLQAGMVVTIEPGFYQIPALLNAATAQQKALINWERLADFADVRGIRIEDEVWVTDTGSTVLTAGLPTRIDAIEARMAAV
jgi:Xaa-Pro aminopeptidase